LEKNQLDFAKKENINPKQSAKDWVHDNIFSDTHEIFFCEFPIILSEWLLRLKDNKGTWRIDSPREWNPELI